VPRELETVPGQGPPCLNENGIPHACVHVQDRSAILIVVVPDLASTCCLVTAFPTGDPLYSEAVKQRIEVLVLPSRPAVPYF
jgi:hypothetical protein